MRSGGQSLLAISFEAEVIDWRGPSPYFFVAIPSSFSAGIQAAAQRASYGWGVVPVEAMLGGVTFTTSLFPRAGNYLLPLKAEVRRRTNVTAGDVIAVEMAVKAPR